MLKERATWKLWASVPMALAGVAALSGGMRGRVDPTGLILGLLTGLFYAGFVLSIRRAGQAPKPLKPLAAICVVSLVAALALVAAGLAEGEHMAPTSRGCFVLLLGLALMGQCLGWTCISGSLTKVPASQAALLLLLQPLLATIWGAFLVPVPEHLSGMQIGGAVLTLGAIYLGSLR